MPSPTMGAADTSTSESKWLAGDQPEQLTTQNRAAGSTINAEQSVLEKTAGEGARAGVPLDLLYYYPIKELETRPVMVRQPILDETPSGNEIAVNGRALLELLIEKNGRVNAVNLVQNNLPASHARQLEPAFSLVEYTPGKKGGLDVRSRLLIEVVYVDGVLHHLPEAPVNLGVFPSAPDVHIPITLPADRHKRKSNPPLP